jgi:GH25 family lysozyme M1 (1,4-beta-N-acetylmuramidase)
VTGQLRGYRGRHRARRAGVAGGALIIIAGAVTFGLIETGGAGAAQLPMPSSCPAASSSSAAAAAAARAAARPAAAAAAVTPLQGVARGVDISSNNAEPLWATLRSGSGDASFVSIKATEGDYYTNNTATTTPVAQPGYAKEVTDATNAGLYVMPYALANPYQGGGNPANGNGSGTCQADYAWQEIGPTTVTSPLYTSSSLSLPVVLDIEPDPYTATEANSNECYGESQSALATWIGDFLTEMQADSGKTPVIYTSPSFWAACIGSLTSFTTTAGTTGSFSSYPLWLADYGVTSPPAVTGGLASPTFWQYSASATFPGADGTIDADYLLPLQQTAKAGTAVTPVQVQSLNSLNGQSVTYTATGLPPGLSISSSGLISGTPTASGSYGALVTATPASTANGAKSSTLLSIWEIPSTLTISAISGVLSTMGTPVSQQVTATDANPGATLTYSASGLPPGLSINSATGLISGWPVTGGTYQNPKVTVTDGQGNTASATFEWIVGTPADTGVTGQIRQFGGSNKCVDDPSSKTANWTPVDLVTCGGKSNQTWTAVQDGTIRVLGHCLTASGIGVYLFACNNTISEQWKAGSFGSIVSARYGTCLNGSPGGVAEGTKLTTASCQNTASKVNQHWSRPVAPIVSGVGARCLNVVPLPGQAVTYYTCGNYATEHWTLTPSGTLQVQSSGKCLTEHSTDGSALIQYNCVKGSANQQFRIEAVNAIATEIQSTESGLCVSVPSLSSPNGSALVLGSCQATPISTWRIG